MLWTIIIILLVLWLLGAFGPRLSSRIPRTGNIVHVLIVIAVILIILHLLADQSITLVTGAGLLGRALALNGAVTMDTNGSPPIANTPLFEFLYLPLIMR